ncbi:MAG TPA: hypothetical protein VGF15_05845 [Solirubrobacteraceae bacterium]|jgi:hypothetical protein
MRDSSIPCPPDANEDWSSTDLALNHAAHLHAEYVGRMQDAGAQLARRVRDAVNVQRLSVPHVAHITGLDEELIENLLGRASRA